MKNNNKNNLKIGDKIFIEQAWEDETGNYHDEYAIIDDMQDDGNLLLTFPDTTDETNNLLRNMDYFANDYKAE